MPRIAVTDPDDPRIAVFQGLRDHQLRRWRERAGGDMEGVFVSEGDLVVERALSAGYRLHSILVDAKRSKPMPDAVPAEIPVYDAGPEVLVRITGYHLHRGMLACFHRRPVPSPDEVLAAHQPLTSLVAEGVNNPTNLGVILRCAAAQGVEAAFLDKTCCDPLYRRAGRVSMGEAYAMPYARLDPFPDGFAPLRSAGVQLLALTPREDAKDISELKLAADEPVAILVGAEGPGLTEAAMDAADQLLRIPMSGTVDSINVGSAAAVAFYALAQARS